MTAGLGALVGSLTVKPLRKVVEKRLPAPGEGPSAEARERGFFEARLRGEGTSARTGQRGAARGQGGGAGRPGLRGHGA